jgi:hypothetical protein
MRGSPAPSSGNFFVCELIASRNRGKSQALPFRL